MSKVNTEDIISAYRSVQFTRDISLSDDKINIPRQKLLFAAASIGQCE